MRARVGRARSAARAGAGAAALSRAARLRRSCCCCSPALVGRSLYLQWIDNEFLQEQGSSRYSREIEVPAHRGRIVDRSGEPLAISTPVKSIWAFPGKVEATPGAARRSSRAALETTPQALAKKLDDGGRLRLPREAGAAGGRRARRGAAASRASTTRTNTAASIPAGETTSHILGFTGDHDVGQEGIELAQQEWLGGKPGSRRVIINRRGDVVEDVEAIRAPQAGRDLALVDRHAAAVPRVPRAEGGRRGEQGEGRRPRDPRRADRRDPGARQLADVQPERAQHGRARAGCATAR